jgi:hypothetical protein
MKLFVATKSVSDVDLHKCYLPWCHCSLKLQVGSQEVLSRNSFCRNHIAVGLCWSLLWRHLQCNMQWNFVSLRSLLIQCVPLRVEPATTACRSSSELTTGKWVSHNAEHSPSHASRWVPSYVGLPVFGRNNFWMSRTVKGWLWAIYSDVCGNQRSLSILKYYPAIRVKWLLKAKKNKFRTGFSPGTSRLRSGVDSCGKSVDAKSCWQQDRTKYVVAHWLERNLRFSLYCGRDVDCELPAGDAVQFCSSLTTYFRIFVTTYNMTHDHNRYLNRI